MYLHTKKVRVLTLRSALYIQCFWMYKAKGHDQTTQDSKLAPEPTWEGEEKHTFCNFRTHVSSLHHPLSLLVSRGSWMLMQQSKKGWSHGWFLQSSVKWLISAVMIVNIRLRECSILNCLFWFRTWGNMTHGILGWFPFFLFLGTNSESLTLKDETLRKKRKDVNKEETLISDIFHFPISAY